MEYGLDVLDKEGGRIRFFVESNSPELVKRTGSILQRLLNKEIHARQPNLEKEIRDLFAIPDDCDILEALRRVLVEKTDMAEALIEIDEAYGRGAKTLKAVVAGVKALQNKPAEEKLSKDDYASLRLGPFANDYEIIADVKRALGVNPCATTEDILLKITSLHSSVRAQTGSLAHIAAWAGTASSNPHEIVAKVKALRDEIEALKKVDKQLHEIAWAIPCDLETPVTERFSRLPEKVKAIVKELQELRNAVQ